MNVATPLLTTATRLIMAEDSPTTRLSISMMLEFEPSLKLISAVSNGRELLESLSLQPTVILMDMNLPDITGIDLIRQVRAVLPLVRIVVMSIEEDYRKAALTAGATAFVEKPFKLDELLALLA